VTWGFAAWSGGSYRDVEELLAERGLDVDRVTIFRWVQRVTPLPIDAAQPCRHSPGDRWLPTRRTSRPPVAGRTCTGRSTSSARSSTSSPPRNGTWPRPELAQAI